MADNGVEIYNYQTNDIMLITALAVGKSLGQAARIAGVSLRTASRRMSDPAFCAELRRVQSETVSQATVELGQAATEAVKKLKKLLQSKSENIQLGAARAVVSLYLKAEDTG
jgi:hypothetical protein